MLDTGLAKILHLQVPSIPHGRVAIADMELIRAGYDAFGDGVTIADYDIVTRQIELLDREGHERQSEYLYIDDINGIRCRYVV